MLKRPSIPGTVYSRSTSVGSPPIESLSWLERRLTDFTYIAEASPSGRFYEESYPIEQLEMGMRVPWSLLVDSLRDEPLLTGSHKIIGLRKRKGSDKPFDSSSRVQVVTESQLVITIDKGDSHLALFAYLEGLLVSFSHIRFTQYGKVEDHPKIVTGVFADSISEQFFVTAARAQPNELRPPAPELATYERRRISLIEKDSTGRFVTLYFEGESNVDFRLLKLSKPNETMMKRLQALSESGQLLNLVVETHSEELGPQIVQLDAIESENQRPATIPSVYNLTYSQAQSDRFQYGKPGRQKFSQRQVVGFQIGNNPEQNLIFLQSSSGAEVEQVVALGLSNDSLKLLLTLAIARKGKLSFDIETYMGRVTLHELRLDFDQEGAIGQGAEIEWQSNLSFSSIDRTSFEIVQVGLIDAYSKSYSIVLRDRSSRRLFKMAIANDGELSALLQLLPTASPTGL